MKWGHICKTRASNLHFRVDVTVAMPGLFFKMNNSLSQNFSSLGM